MIDGKIPVFGQPDPGAVQQIRTCVNDPSAVAGALMADHHKGYSQPIGGVVVYDQKVSPSGVGYDIGCGNLAVRTLLKGSDLRPDIERIMDRVYAEIAFGVGINHGGEKDHPLFDDERWLVNGPVKNLRDKGRGQLGSVGSGNHYVDLFVDEDDRVWVGVHFGSRGVGHSIASGFLNLAAGRKWFDKAPGESMDQPPTVLDLKDSLGQEYMVAMGLAGHFAEAGRESVVRQVLRILGTYPAETVSNHHNFAWVEHHNGQNVVVVRKGATPNFPGQKSFVGGSMGDISVIIEGLDSDENDATYQSTIHGAGRVMSRTAAAGRPMKFKPDGTRYKWGEKRPREGGQITRQMMTDWIASKGVTLRGAGCDEAPQAYKRLPDVLQSHSQSIKIVNELTPIGVAMAGEDVEDPWKD